MTKAEIVNASLALIGENSIASYEDSSVRANLVNRLWGLTLDEAFSAGNWRWCEIHAQLKKSTEEGYYLLPSDMETIVCLKVGFSGLPIKNYKMENGKIYIPNKEDVEIVYKARLDESKWPQYFRAVVIRGVARNLGAGLALEGSQARDRAYQQMLDEASRADSLTRPKRTFLGVNSAYRNAYMGS